MKTILRYLFFFIPTALVIVSIWSFVISANLFYCSDPLPFMDFLPPFSHGSQVGDYYIVNEKLVWMLWTFLVVLIFLIPYYLVSKTSPKKKRSTKKKI